MNRRSLGPDMTDSQRSGRKEPSWTQPRSGPEAELLEMAEGLRTAELRGDVPFLERVLAEDFLGIGPRGFVLTKDAWLARHRSGDLKYKTIERDEASLRTYGDAAILTSRETSQTEYRGQPVPVGALRATHVFVRKGRDWQLAGVQYSPILGAP
jgi:hypothetical protein